MVPRYAVRTYGTPYVSARSRCPVRQVRTLRRRPVRVACTYRRRPRDVRVSLGGHVAAQLEQTDSQVLLDRLEHGESVGELEHAHLVTPGAQLVGLRRKSQVLTMNGEGVLKRDQQTSAVDPLMYARGWRRASARNPRTRVLPAPQVDRRGRCKFPERRHQCACRDPPTPRGLKVKKEPDRQGLRALRAEGYLVITPTWPPPWPSSSPSCSRTSSPGRS